MLLEVYGLMPAHMEEFTLDEYNALVRAEDDKAKAARKVKG